jgi:hypothetical protein
LEGNPSSTAGVISAAAKASFVGAKKVNCYVPLSLETRTNLMMAVFKVVNDERSDISPEMVGVSSSSLLQLDKMIRKAEMIV